MARFSRLLPLSALLLPALLLASACGRSGDEALEMAVIDSPDNLFDNDLRLSEGGQLVRAATVEGLVGLDAEGQVIPALADRWIVTDDGRSYIFRLRDGSWPDGTELTAEDARDLLKGVIRRLRGTSLGRDLAQVDQVRAMAGRVVEIRLKGAMPDFLQLLAQPELGLARKRRGAGPMVLRRVNDTAVLSMMSPAQRGLPTVEGWQDAVRELRLHALPPADAIRAFDEGEVDLVLGGRIQDLPRADTGPLSRGTVRLDPALGLFGLQVVRPEGILSDPSGREAVAMAIDRDGLLAPFNVGGWSSTTRIVAPGLVSDLGTIGERWPGMSLDQRRAGASSRVSAWKSQSGADTVQLSVWLPEGPGSDMLFTQLAEDLAAVGIDLTRAKKEGDAPLVLVDRVARYASPQWFLNQFACGMRGSVCSSAADKLAIEAATTGDAAERAAAFAEAEAELTQANVFIPFGPPVRFSLVRAGVNGYEANRWVFHPLPPLAVVPR